MSGRGPHGPSRGGWELHHFRGPSGLLDPPTSPRQSDVPAPSDLIGPRGRARGAKLASRQPPPARSVAARTFARPEPAPAPRRHSGGRRAAGPRGAARGREPGLPPSFARLDAARCPPVQVLIFVLLDVLQAIVCGLLKKPCRLLCPCKTSSKTAASKRIRALGRLRSY
ncbi:chromosome alignment-maintaining phosphoprotein 1 isoform X2 [Camelus ferus]|uniref:Chromosome alignment-maintaining phosphoprotein 1 isoform X2 n=1 Tax=Camelus ferus TaxID=419612 RepID=A0A8B8UDP1_CAMFR|nr:chromosome alignment-maintaining phosphoprotein 1 isoform X2 [Camelus ferus]XP_032352444.1 chromosome alignment-maintaining phosphoprotein 1 isoform X2 [Camelus ferus]